VGVHFLLINRTVNFFFFGHVFGVECLSSVGPRVTLMAR
jgi:hypothetical protein